MDYTVHGILQARILERVPFPLVKGFFTNWALSEAQSLVCRSPRGHQESDTTELNLTELKN